MFIIPNGESRMINVSLAREIRISQDATQIEAVFENRVETLVQVPEHVSAEATWLKLQHDMNGGKQVIDLTPRKMEAPVGAGGRPASAHSF